MDARKHWAADSFTEIKSVISGTGWSFSEPNSHRGPIVCTHVDGTEVSMVNSSMTNNFVIEYDCSDDTTVSMAVTDDVVRYPTVSTAIEWFIHILERHEKIN